MTLKMTGLLHPKNPDGLRYGQAAKGKTFRDIRHGVAEFTSREKGFLELSANHDVARPTQ
jgi:hypothetical protein